MGLQKAGGVNSWLGKRGIIFDEFNKFIDLTL
jgi:hypothetical protein